MYVYIYICIYKINYLCNVYIYIYGLGYVIHFRDINIGLP